jgi:prophage regulatory protein
MNEMVDSLILREPEVVIMVRLSPATIRRRVQDGSFPAPVRLGPKAKGWRRDDLVAWVARLPSA